MTTRRFVASITLLAIAGAGASIPEAHAQCDGQWLPGQEQYDVGAAPTDVVIDALYWDPDGPGGPEEPNLIVAGAFTQRGGVTLNHVARWNGRSWMPMGLAPPTGPGFNNTVFDLCVWDSDGPDPESETEQLIAVGAFTSSAGVITPYVARWTGTVWQPIGPSVGQPSRAIAWDPDGPGPLHDQLFVAGGNVVIAGTRGIARWDGTSWNALGPGLSPTTPIATALHAWDPDGPGPTPESLYVSGELAVAGIPGATGFVRWDGQQWHAVDGGISQQESSLFATGVFDMMPWDPDGDGPLEPKLLVVGNFGRAGALQVNSAALFDGKTWSVPPFDIGGGSAILDIEEFDLDGDGPGPRTLVCAGDFANAAGVANTQYIAQWSSAGWAAIGRGLGQAGAYARKLSYLDADGPGPRSPTLLVAGAFSTALNSPPGGFVMTPKLAEWNGAQWSLPGVSSVPEIARVVDLRVVRTFPPDPSTGAGPRLLAAGNVITPDIPAQRQVVEWDGIDWHIHRESTATTVIATALTLWDSDGPGGAEPRIVIVDTSSGNRVRALVDGAWVTLGTASGGAINALTTWDPDADGPALPQLIAAGEFTSMSSVTVNRIARWDGSAWASVGGGVSTTGSVKSLTHWDPDGPGPLVPELVAVGTFPSMGGVTVNAAARWNGTQWSAFGTGLRNGASVGNAVSVCTLDRDADGPQTDSLVVFGVFTTAGGVTVTDSAVWTGAAWEPFATAIPAVAGSTTGLVAFDHDNDPATPDRIVVSSESLQLDVPGPFNSRGVAIWSGAQWLPVASALDSTGQPSPQGLARSLAVWKPQDGGPVELVVGGSFRAANTFQSQGFARWTADTTPWFVSHPLPASVGAGEAAYFVARPAFGYGALEGGLAYQWLRNGQPVADGPGGAAPGGGFVIGSSGVIRSRLEIALTIEDAAPADAGEFSLRIFNDCGESVSTPATLTVKGGGPVCLTDVNNDGVVNSTDVSDFINIWFDDQSAGTLLADFNNDGVSNSTDVSDFINEWFVETAEGCG